MLAAEQTGVSVQPWCLQPAGRSYPGPEGTWGTDTSFFTGWAVWMSIYMPFWSDEEKQSLIRKGSLSHFCPKTVCESLKDLRKAIGVFHACFRWKVTQPSGKPPLNSLLGMSLLEGTAGNRSLSPTAVISDTWQSCLKTWSQLTDPRFKQPEV